MKSLALLVLALLVAAPALGNAGKWYVPDFVESQSGGYVGYVSAGFGYRLSRHWDTDFLFGYVPECEGGEDLYQVSWKNGIHPFKYDFRKDGGKAVGELSIFYIAVTVVYGFDNDLFLNLPDRYPEGHYPPTALHLALGLGAGARYGSHGLFFEASALDSGIRAYFYNFGFLNIGDITTFAAGYRFYI